MSRLTKYRSYVLPVAILLGFLFHDYCVRFSFLVPYLIFAILVLNFVAVDLRHLRFSMLHFWLMLFQTVVSVALYVSAKALGGGETVAQALMIGVLCPVASSVVVVSSMLGADRMTTTSYTMLCNIGMSVIAPLYFSVIGVHPELSFGMSFLMTFKRIAPTIALPFFVVLLLQILLPKANDALCKYQSMSFYLWAVALFLTLGKTISFMLSQGGGSIGTIALLGILSLALCALQFAFGKWLGGLYGDRIAGGQLLGQKNTALGIWMSTVYLEPLSSVLLAFYIILQNLFNSLQLWYHDKRM